MKIPKIRKESILIPTNFKEFWMECFIFITFFNSFFVSICNRFSFGTIISFIFVIFTLIGVILSGQMKLYSREFLTFIGLSFLCWFNCLIFNVALTPYVITFLVCYIPLIAVTGIIDLRKYNRYLYKLSCIYIIILFIYMVQIYAVRSTVDNDYMDFLGFAYYSIPAVLIIINEYYETKEKTALFFIGVGLAYLIICGTRGPMICTLAFGLYRILGELKKSDTWNKIRVAIIFLGIAILGFSSRQIAGYLYPIFRKYGYSTRFLLFFMKDISFFNLTGREEITRRVISSIKSHFLFGAGLMGDRAVLGGKEQSYCHNLVLEIIHSFGFPVGMFLVIGLFCLVISAYMKTKSRVYKNYIALLTASSVLKLFMSSSFMQEYVLFMLIGICFAAFRSEEDDKIPLISR